MFQFRHKSLELALLILMEIYARPKVNRTKGSREFVLSRCGFSLEYGALFTRVSSTKCEHNVMLIRGKRVVKHRIYYTFMRAGAKQRSAKYDSVSGSFILPFSRITVFSFYGFLCVVLPICTEACYISTYYTPFSLLARTQPFAFPCFNICTHICTESTIPLQRIPLDHTYPQDFHYPAS